MTLDQTIQRADPSNPEVEARLSRRTLISAVAASAAATAWPLQAFAQLKDEYRLAAVLPKPYPWGIGADRWIALIAERTQGRIKARAFNNAQLTGGDSTKEFAALRSGTIDLAVCAAQNWTGQVKELNLFSLPFLLLDFRAVDAVLKGSVGTELFKRVASRGVVPLAWGENGFRELTNSKRPIREPNDLKGFKIRIAASPTMIDTLSALGANPTQMSWADVQPALATGAVDGQENPLQVIKYAKMNTLGQKHLSLWNHVYDPLVFAASEKTWETWTPADREIVRQTAIEAAAEQVALSRKGVQGDDALIRELEASGMEVARLTVPEKLAFRKVAQPVFDRWAANIGTELVQSAARLAAAAT